MKAGDAFEGVIHRPPFVRPTEGNRRAFDHLRPIVLEELGELTLLLSRSGHHDPPTTEGFLLEPSELIAQSHDLPHDDNGGWAYPLSLLHDVAQAPRDGLLEGPATGPDDRDRRLRCRPCFPRAATISGGRPCLPAPSTKDEGIATLEPHHDLAPAGSLDHQAIDLLLGQTMFPSPLPHMDPLGIGGGRNSEGAHWPGCRR